MSQSGVYLAGIIPPGGPVETLTGNTGGAVPPTAGNIFVVGENKSTLTATGTFSSSVTSDGDPGTSTLIFSDLNTFIATTTTMGASPTGIFTVTLVPDSAVTIEALIVGAKSALSFAAGISAKIVVGGRKAGAGTASLFGAPLVEYITDSGTGTPSVSAAASGSDISVSVIGESGIQYSWTAYVRYVVQQ